MGLRSTKGYEDAAGRVFGINDLDRSSTESVPFSDFILPILPRIVLAFWNTRRKNTARSGNRWKRRA